MGLKRIRRAIRERRYAMEKDFCEYCNSTLPEIEKPVTVYRHRRKEHFIFEQVPAKVCQTCGERYFSATSVSRMDSEMKATEHSADLIPVPVIQLQPVT